MKGGGTIGSINLSRSNDDENSDVNFSGQVHQPPCCIKCDGPCAVSDYFRPKPTGTEVVGIRVEKAHFSMRKLHGVTVPLSSG